MFKNKLDYKLLNLLLLVAIMYLLINTFNWWGALIKNIASILMPFFIAFIIAYFLHPCVKKLENLGIRKSIANTSVILIIFCIVIILFYITIPLMYNQIVLLSGTIENILTNVSVRFELDVGDFRDTINIALKNTIGNLGKYISSGLFTILSKSIDFLTKSIITTIVAIYFLIDMDKIKNKISTILRKTNKRLFKYVEQLDIEMSNYLIGFTISLIVEFIEYSFLFFIVGHPNWLLLGALASITSVVPYFGALVTNIVAVVLASAISLKLFIATSLICLIFPNIDGYIISPKIFGKTNNINPICTIFAVTLGGSIAGILGIVLAVPCYVLINCTYNFFKKDIYKKLDSYI